MVGVGKKFAGPDTVHAFFGQDLILAGPGADIFNRGPGIIRGTIYLPNFLAVTCINALTSILQ